MFSESDYTIRLLWKRSDVWTYEGLKMAPVNRQLIFAISDSAQIHTSNSLRSSLVL